MITNFVELARLTALETELARLKTENDALKQAASQAAQVKPDATRTVIIRRFSTTTADLDNAAREIERMQADGWRVVSELTAGNAQSASYIVRFERRPAVPPPVRTLEAAAKVPTSTPLTTIITPERAQRNAAAQAYCDAFDAKVAQWDARLQRKALAANAIGMQLAAALQEFSRMKFLPTEAA